MFWINLPIFGKAHLALYLAALYLAADSVQEVVLYTSGISAQHNTAYMSHLLAAGDDQQLYHITLAHMVAYYYFGGPNTQV